MRWQIWFHALTNSEAVQGITVAGRKQEEAQEKEAAEGRPELTNTES